MLVGLFSIRMVISMETLNPGTVAPAFELVGTDGESYTSLKRPGEALLLAVFFKVSCPTSQYTLPFIQRIFQNYSAHEKLQIYGISQDNRDDTQAFAQEFGLSFPLLLDTSDYAVSSQYRLTHVPSSFLIDGMGRLRFSSVGFWKADWLRVTVEISQFLGVPEKSIFRVDEDIPDHRYG
ncbi:MAG: TlpA family protein disulfide reductase [Acidobacteria bacterium]|nr:TlpA family protein disulfide reductase [Acidobacteriota bacterium]MBI3658776.1 TlpA family protein disulfide reductase [Acidobacteriota bacterium]